MIKKIITYRKHINKRNKWIKSLGKDKHIRNLANDFYARIDKSNYTYLFSWNNEPLLQTPEDLIILQEIIAKTKPEVIIELGVAWGGSMLYLDSLAKCFPIKKIIGIDIFIPNDLKKRLAKKISTKAKLIEDDTCSAEVKKYLLKLKKKYKRFLIHLDSDHTKNHVLKELNFYSSLISKNDYIIVGDTIIDYIPKQKHRLRKWHKGNSPKSALDEFLKNKHNKKKFKIDTYLSGKQMLRNNPYGYVKKISN